MQPISVDYDFRRDQDGARAVLSIKGGGLAQKSLYYEIRGPAAPRKRPTGEFAVMAVLPMAMRLHAPIQCFAPVERGFLEGIEELQDAWHRWRPDLFRPVRITVGEETQSRLPLRRKAVLALSGDLDSTFALHAHKRGLIGRRALDITAAIFIQGFDIPAKMAEMAEAARARAHAIAAHYGAPLTSVSTDWRRVSSPYQQTHAMGLASVMHLFGSGFDHAVIATETPYEQEVPGRGASTITNPMLGATGFPLHTTGGGWSGSGKAAALAGEARVLEHLHVCLEDAANCGVCPRCVLTKLAFLAAGVERVPALGDMPTADAVGRLELDPKNADRGRDLLTHGNWRGHEDIRRALEAAVDRATPGADAARRRHRRNWLRLLLMYRGA